MKVYHLYTTFEGDQCPAQITGPVLGSVHVDPDETVDFEGPRRHFVLSSRFRTVCGEKFGWKWKGAVQSTGLDFAGQTRNWLFDNIILDIDLFNFMFPGESSSGRNKKHAGKGQISAFIGRFVNSCRNVRLFWKCIKLHQYGQKI